MQLVVGKSKMSTLNTIFAYKEEREHITSGRRSFSLLVDVVFLTRIAKAANVLPPLSQLLPLMTILASSG